LQRSLDINVIDARWSRWVKDLNIVPVRLCH